MRKPTMLYVMYSHQYDYDRPITKLHGIFTEEEISNYAKKRAKGNNNYPIGCMIVPLNKFVEQGVEL